MGAHTGTVSASATPSDVYVFAATDERMERFHCENSKVAAGYDFTCAVLRGGGVKCWGLADAGQTGQDASTNFPTDSTALSALATIDLGGDIAHSVCTAGAGPFAGGMHACVITGRGTVKCWGGNIYKALGYPSPIIVGDGVTGFMASAVDVDLATASGERKAARRSRRAESGEALAAQRLICGAALSDADFGCLILSNILISERLSKVVNGR